VGHVRKGRMGERGLLREAKFAVAVLTAVLVAAACAGGDEQAEQEEGDGASTLVVAAAATPTTLDPEFSSSPQDREIDVAVYDRFTQFQVTEQDGVEQADLKAPPVGLLAESWEVSGDGETYTFRLREGVESYFGNELTADDVIWSWDRVFAQESQGLFPLNVSSVEEGSYSKVDKYTVRVQLSEPNPLLPVVLATPVPGAVVYDSTEVKKHATDDEPWAADWLATHTASFGPYHATEYTPGQQVVFEANPNYFQEAPAIQKIIYREVPDPASRLSLLQAGEVDVAEDLNAQQRQTLEGQSGVKIVSVPGNLMIAFGVHNQMEPFDDKRVRQALAYAMPIDGIIETVFFNEPSVRLFRGYVADTFPGYPDVWPYQPQNLDKARQLLREAGQESFSFELSYTTTYPEHEKIAQLIRSALADVDVDVVLNKLTPAKYQEQYYTHKAQSVLVQDAAFVADAAYPLFLYYGAGPGAVGNWIEYRNPEVQDQIDAALAEPDPKRRVQMGLEANRGIVEGVPWPMHLGIGFHLPMQESVQGFTWRPHNLVHFYDLSKTSEN
jgi:peptide/nickel transport system substrate-binding protein